jgi:phosphohistidine phosphatase SixA
MGLWYILGDNKLGGIWSRHTHKWWYRGSFDRGYHNEIILEISVGPTCFRGLSVQVMSPRKRKRSAFKYSSSIKWVICFFYIILIDASANPLSLTLEEYAKTPFGNVIFLRHTFAPGIDANGEPAKFKIDDCSTQRNLDTTGIEEAKIIGGKFIQNGIKFGAIFSSQWCRCLETGRLLDLGDVFPEGSLNSGFKGLFEQEETLSKLRKNLGSLKNKQGLILMITHSGVISAITGLSVKSGGAVAYDTITKESRTILIK